VLAITIALGRWEEYELHVRAALLGGAEDRLTPDELKEVLMQSAIYAGVPAANTALLPCRRHPARARPANRLRPRTGLADGGGAFLASAAKAVP
jgi:hypothetical protein